MSIRIGNWMRLGDDCEVEERFWCGACGDHRWRRLLEEELSGLPEGGEEVAYG